jgi:hypothetical protein
MILLGPDFAVVFVGGTFLFVGVGSLLYQIIKKFLEDKI